MRRGFLFLVIGLAAFALAACGGGDDDSSSSSASGGGDDAAEVLSRSTAANVLLLAEDTMADDILPFIAEACREDFEEAVPALQAVFAEVFAEVTAEIRPVSVEFESDDRALVTRVVVLDGEEIPADDADDELWVKEDGEWRAAINCEAFGTA